MTTPNDPGQPPPYGQQPPGQQPYGQQPPSQPPPGYGTPPSYGAPPPYGATPPYGAAQQNGAPPPYGAPAGYGGPVYASGPRNGMGIAALVLGVLSIPLGFVFIGGLLAVLAIVFGWLGRRKAKRGLATNPRVALFGILCGAVGLVIVILLAVVVGPHLNSLFKCDNAAVTQADRQQCSTQFKHDVTGN